MLILCTLQKSNGGNLGSREGGEFYLGHCRLKYVREIRLETEVQQESLITQVNVWASVLPLVKSVKLNNDIKTTFYTYRGLYIQYIV